MSLFPSRSLPGVSAALGEKTIHVCKRRMGDKKYREPANRFAFQNKTMLCCRPREEIPATSCVARSISDAVTLARHFELAFVGKGK